jgi:hypothetical protein
MTGPAGVPAAEFRPSSLPLTPPALDERSGGRPAFANLTAVADAKRSKEAAPDTLLRRASAPAARPEDAAAVKTANELAARYARERADNLAAQLNQHFADRTPNKPGAGGAQPEAAKINAGEVLEQAAIEQMHRTVNLVVPPLVVREFAAPRPGPASLPDAADMPDTVLWQPVIVLPIDGKATLTFHLGAAPGGYEVVVAGHTADGRLGAVRGFIPVARAETPSPVAPPAPALPPIVPSPAP